MVHSLQQKAYSIPHGTNEKYSQQLIDAVAELLLPEIRKFYESDEGKAVLEEWVKDKAEREH